MSSRRGLPIDLRNTLQVDSARYCCLCERKQEVAVENVPGFLAFRAPAFDLTINGIHTYHVTAGDEEVLVHNTRGSTNFPDEPDLRLSPDEVATANRLVELERFKGTEFRDFEAEFSDNTFDYIDQNGDLYAQIGGRTEISDECSSWVS